MLPEVDFKNLSQINKLLEILKSNLHLVLLIQSEYHISSLDSKSVLRNFCLFLSNSKNFPDLYLLATLALNEENKVIMSWCEGEQVSA